MAAEADIEKLKLEEKKGEKAEGKKEKEPKAKKEPKPKQQGEAKICFDLHPVGSPAVPKPGPPVRRLWRIRSVPSGMLHVNEAMPSLFDRSQAPLPCLCPLAGGGGGGGGKKEVKKETLLGLSVKKSEDFGKWYSEVRFI